MSDTPHTHTQTHTHRQTHIHSASRRSHTGSDGRYYILDAARLMPPEPPTSPGSHLYRLLRPELVRASPVPLCSDAYTKFIEHDPQKRYDVTYIQTDRQTDKTDRQADTHSTDTDTLNKYRCVSPRPR